MPASPKDASSGGPSGEPPSARIRRAPRSWPIASKAQRDGITTLSTAPALAIRCTGRMAPENSTAGKHSIGRASVAWADVDTIADVSRPSPRAAIAHSSSPKPIDA